MNSNRVNHNRDNVRQWWKKDYIIAQEFFKTDKPDGWILPSNVEIIGNPRERILRITGLKRAVWKVYQIKFGRINFRIRTKKGSVGLFGFKESEDYKGLRGYYLRIESNQVTLLRKEAGEFKELVKKKIELSLEKWQQWTVWFENNRIIGMVNGINVFEVEDPKPLPPGYLSFGSEDEGIIDFRDIGLLSGIKGTDFSKKGLDLHIPAKMIEEDKLDTYPLATFVPLQIQQFFCGKKPVIINAGEVPPNYLHTWGIDIKGFETLRLAFKTGDLVLDWGSGDRIIIVDSYGDTLKVYNSYGDVANHYVTIPSTAFDAGKSHVRFYIILSTSSLETRRSFKVYGLYNNSINTGNEESLLVGDDLNYNPEIGPWFKASGGYEPEQPWRPKGGNTNPFIEPIEEPKVEDGWYLLGKNITDEEPGFYSLIYYNEKTSRIRAYLFNNYLETDVSGYAVQFRLRCRNPTGFEFLEGALFDLDVRPHKWSKATVLIPIWPPKTWAMAEVPFLYPMVTNFPEGQPKKDIELPNNFYRSIYEDRLTESLENVIFQVSITPYFKATLVGDVIGDAIGYGIEETKKTDLVEELATGLFDAFKEGCDYYSKGRDFAKSIYDYYDDQKKAGLSGIELKKLAKLAENGVSFWSAAFSVVGAGISVYKNFFEETDPMQLAIELQVRATMTGSVFSSFQTVFHEFYLPGRFSIQNTFLSDQHSKVSDRIEASIPRYDRTLGHFGYRYDPKSIEIRMLRLDDERSEPDYEQGLIEEYPYRYQWYTNFYFPSVEKPTFPYPESKYKWDHHSKELVDVGDLKISGQHPYSQIDRFLPLIFNPYAEIVPMKPTVVGTNSKPKPVKDQQNRWFDWIQDISWKTHVIAEPDDSSFPNTEDTGKGPSLFLKVFNGNVKESTGQNGLASGPLPEGIWLEVNLKSSYIPRKYHEFNIPEDGITDVHTHTFGEAWYWKADPLDREHNPWIDDFTAEHGTRGLKTKWYRPFDPDDPFPITDVILYWDIAYFYYARSRKENGQVPKLMNITQLKSPITISITRHLIKYSKPISFVKETHVDVKTKSRLLIK